jgi:hypothetical protein
MAAQVQHDSASRKYFVEAGGEEAHLLYVPAGEGVVEITHTYVPPEMRGQGIAEQLALAALEDIRERGERFIPSCPFVARFVERHPEWQKEIAR